MIFLNQIDPDRFGPVGWRCPRNWRLIEYVILKLGGEPGSYLNDIEFLEQHGIIVAHTTRHSPDPVPVKSVLQDFVPPNTDNLILMFDCPEEEMLFRLTYL